MSSSTKWPNRGAEPTITDLGPLKVAMWLAAPPPGRSATTSRRIRHCKCNPVRRPCPGRSLQAPPRVVTASIGRYGRHFGASVGDLWRHAVARRIRTEPKSVFKTTRHGPAWQGTSRRLSLSKSGVIDSHRGFESHALRAFVCQCDASRPGTDRLEPHRSH
jgi:hypothetical protein